MKLTNHIIRKCILQGILTPCSGHVDRTAWCVFPASWPLCKGYSGILTPVKNGHSGKLTPALTFDSGILTPPFFCMLVWIWVITQSDLIAKPFNHSNYVRHSNPYESIKTNLTLNQSIA
jgi:hypothetical protein